MKMQFSWDENVYVNEAVFIHAGAYGTDIFCAKPLSDMLVRVLVSLILDLKNIPYSVWPYKYNQGRYEVKISLSIMQITWFKKWRNI